MSSGDSVVRFGPFQLLEPLGGGMGIVYRARRDGAGQDVAVKLLRQDRLLDGEARERFARERRALQQLRHPGICPVLEAGEVDALPYLCMPLLQGQALSAYIDAAVKNCVDVVLPGGDPTAPAWRRIVEVLAKVADALHVAHAVGYCHRDVKPGNLWIDPRGEPMLLDFGLARDSADRYRQLTRTGQIVGTPTYLAPEQLDSRLGGIDARADVYGLCAVLFESVTKAPPFLGSSRSQLFANILTGMLPDPRRYCPELPEGLARLLEAGMARRRHERPASAAALADDLRRLLRGEPLTVRRPFWGLRLLRRARSRSTSLAIAAGLLLSLGLSLSSLGHLARAATTAEQHQSELDHDIWVGRLELARTAYRLLPPPWPQHRAVYVQWLEEHGEPLLAAPAAAEAGSPDLHAFAKSAVAEVRHRLAHAEVVAQLSIAAHADAWARAAAAVAADQRFAVPQLVPQVGLVPLGADPQSGLQEFYDLASGDPELPLPQRDEQGHLQLAQRHGIVFVLVPGGPFQPLGSGETVQLAPFLLAKHELTRSQHALLDMGNDPSQLPLGPTRYLEDQTWRHPANMLDYEAEQALLQRWGLQLPTVLQWQRAARAGGDDDRTTMPGNFSDSDDGFRAGAPVGSFPANGFGFLDMLGNQHEYAADAAGSQRLPARPGDGLRGEATGKLRLAVGGSFGSPRWMISGYHVMVVDQRDMVGGCRPLRKLFLP